MNDQRGKRFLEETRERTDEALESEARFPEVFDHAPAGMALIDRDGRWMRANRAFCRMLGYSEGEIRGRSVQSFSHPDDVDKAGEGYRRLRAGEDDSLHLEERLIRHDGRIVWAETRVAAVRGLPGERLYFIAQIQDITERKRIEENFRQSEERFRRSFEPGLIGMAITSPTKGCMEVNDRICEIFGYSRSELLQLTWIDLTHPDDVAADVAYFNRVLSGEIDGYSIDKRFIRKDGGVIHATISVKCLRRPDGAPDYFLALLQDITERKQVEEALRKSDDRFHLIARATNDAVWDWDISADILWWNESFKTLFGYKAEEIEPGVESWTSRIHPEDKERVLSETHAAIDGGRQYWSSEYRFRRADGSYADIFDRGYVVHVRNGKPVRMVGAMIDITDRKRAEEALERYADRLQSLSGQLLEAQETERRRIARELHDEIGQSLTAIKMQLHAQRRSKTDRSTLEGCIEIVNLALSRVRDLSLDLHPPQLDELGLVATLRWHLDRQVKAANLVPCFSADPLPARLRPDVEIACFRVTQEALTNVIRHAGAKEVSIELRQRGGELHLIIGDDGRGFDVEAARDRAVQGASLGLIGMTERVELAGGRLEWRSASGAGTQVHAVFPLADTASRKRSRRRKG